MVFHELEGYKEHNNQLSKEIERLKGAIQGFVKDFEGDYVMEDGRIVDNPSNILVTNYEIMKKLTNN